MLNLPNLTEPNAIPGLSAIAGKYKALLCDIWGVIHNGREHFPAAVQALLAFKAQGGRITLITNAPRPFGAIEEQLRGLAVPREAYDHLVTSGDVTLALMLERADAPIHHIGPERDLALYTTAESITGKAPRLVPLEEATYVICTGLFDDTVERPEDYSDDLAFMLKRNLPMICANPDIIVHRGDEEVFCAGALAAVYETMGGTVIQAGKPFPPIYDMALKTLGEGIDPKQVLAVGDAFHTDMAGARGRGLDSLFITGGIHRSAIHPKGVGHVDSEGLMQLLSNEGFSPRYMAPTLVW